MNIIKKGAILAFRGAMGLTYGVMKLLTPQKNRVVFLSRQQDTPSANFMRISQELDKLEPGIELCYSCKLGLKSELGLSYTLLMLRQLALLAGARACITESYCPPISLFRHRRGMRVVQIWHSMVAIKKFGWQTVGMPEGSDEDTARLMKMHAGYDYVITGSEFQAEFMAEAMNTPKERILPLGLPCADRLMNTRREAFRGELQRAYPQINADKRIVLYLPTMRRGRAVPTEGLADCLGENDVLIMRKHPIDRHTVIDNDGIIDGEKLSTGVLLRAADCVISDYSGAAAEASLMDVPVYFYTPDEAQYSEECGLNIRPSEAFPAITADSAETLKKLLHSPYPHGEIDRLRELLAGGCDGHSAENIARLTLGLPQNGRV